MLLFKKNVTIPENLHRLLLFALLLILKDFKNVSNYFEKNSLFTSTLLDR